MRTIAVVTMAFLLPTILSVGLEQTVSVQQHSTAYKAMQAGKYIREIREKNGVLLRWLFRYDWMDVRELLAAEKGRHDRLQQ